jgi:hypothetical protein
MGFDSTPRAGLEVGQLERKKLQNELADLTVSQGLSDLGSAFNPAKTTPTAARWSSHRQISIGRPRDRSNPEPARALAADAQGPAASTSV